MSQDLASQWRYLRGKQNFPLRQNNEAEARVLGMGGARPVSAALGIAASPFHIGMSRLSILALDRAQHRALVPHSLFTFPS